VKSITGIPISDYDYELPLERIAAYPLENRDESNLLLMYPDGSLKKDIFRNIAEYLEPEGLMVFNNSKVIPARIIFETNTGAKVEIFCLSPVKPSEYQASLQTRQTCTWECMIGNLKRFGQKYLEQHVNAGNKNITLKAEKAGNTENPALIRFSWDMPDVSFSEILACCGHTPLPPYIKRPAEKSDVERYQTLYSKVEGSVAAPTAGLHFTSQVFDNLMKRSVEIEEITLHVGAGTFQPVKTPSVMEHKMHSEFFRVPSTFIKKLLNNKGQVTAVGTTAVRTLETLYWLGVKILLNKNTENDILQLGQWEVYHLPDDIKPEQSLHALEDFIESHNLDTISAFTSLLIIPGYKFKITDALVTNFHLPKSTLLLLIAAFTGDSWKKAYSYAMKNNFRFLSYGDSSLLFKVKEKDLALSQ